jgi:DNA-binding FadR family transcriptional regulator
VSGGSQERNREVAADLVKSVTAGRYRPGDVLPGVPALAAAYRVDASAVRRALHQLAADGVVQLNLQAVVTER